ncbi:MAG: BLUF domain-containing protein, partial [Methylomicrobium sp.]|nr:BLUF domain-containing protein [Methylomicrobium sp.]
YISQAVRPMPENEIEALLEQTRQFNKLNGITGCLLHRDGWFMQLIEGSPEKVMALAEKIKLDPRHKDMQVVIQGPERRRLFPEWSMGYREVDQANDELDFSSWRKRVIGFDELAEDAKICYEFITSFKTRRV